jgi:hypothetical protein
MNLLNYSIFSAIIHFYIQETFKKRVFIKPRNYFFEDSSSSYNPHINTAHKFEIMSAKNLKSSLANVFAESATKKTVKESSFILIKKQDPSDTSKSVFPEAHRILPSSIIQSIGMILSHPINRFSQSGALNYPLRNVVLIPEIP